MIVVEVYDYTPKLTAVTLRHCDLCGWSYILVKKTSSHTISFGDHVSAKVDSSGLSTGLFWLHRGPLMKFHLFLADFPDDLLSQILATSPATTIYGDNPDIELGLF